MSTPKLAGFLQTHPPTCHYKEETVSASGIEGVLRTYFEGELEVYSREEDLSPFYIFEEDFESREEALEALERQLLQYRDELAHKLSALDKILAGPPGTLGKSLLERVAGEGGLHED